MERAPRNNRSSGFTILEIVIAILVLVTLAAISVPKMLTARESSNKAACLSNLRQIEAAKQEFLMANPTSDSVIVNVATLKRKGYIKGNIACQSGGTYVGHPAKDSTRCTVHGGIQD